jgi:hypothetical protein
LVDNSQPVYMLRKKLRLSCSLIHVKLDLLGKAMVFITNSLLDN